MHSSPFCFTKNFTSTSKDAGFFCFFLMKWHVFSIEPWFYCMSLPFDLLATIREIQWLAQVTELAQDRLGTWIPGSFCSTAFFPVLHLDRSGPKEKGGFLSKPHGIPARPGRGPRLLLISTSDVSYTLPLKTYRSEFMHTEVFNWICRPREVTRLE